MKKLNKKGFTLRGSKGFTLIEVVLVIAIGALIFLLAFIAFRNAQVSRRDSQRRNALDTIAAELSNYASDNGGNYPVFNYSSFLTDYAATLTDPSTKEAYKSSFSNPPVVGETSYSYNPANGTNKGCDGVTTLKGNGFTVKMKLEKGTACRDSL